LEAEWLRLAKRASILAAWCADSFAFLFVFISSRFRHCWLCLVARVPVVDFSRAVRNISCKR